MADGPKICLDGRLEWYYNVFTLSKMYGLVLQYVVGSVEGLEWNAAAADSVYYDHDVLALARI